MAKLATQLNFTGSTAGCKIQTAGKTMPSTTINALSDYAEWIMQDAFTMGGGGGAPSIFTLSRGIFRLNGYSLSGSLIAISGSSVRNLDMGNSSINTTYSSGYPFDCGTSTNLTFISTNSTITIGNSISASINIAQDVQLDKVVVSTSSLALTLRTTGTSFNMRKITVNLLISGATIITFLHGKIYNIGEIVVVPNNSKYLFLVSDLSNNSWTLAGATKRNYLQWTKVKDSSTSDTDNWNAFTSPSAYYNEVNMVPNSNLGNNVDLGGNAGWNFSQKLTSVDEVAKENISKVDEV